MAAGVVLIGGGGIWLVNAGGTPLPGGGKGGGLPGGSGGMSVLKVDIDMLRIIYELYFFLF
jgi:hypothetical protein